MSHIALRCFREIIAISASGIFPNMDTLSQYIHGTLPYTMYFF